MGRDKATIEIAGVPLIRRIYDVVADLGSVRIVTPWAAKYRPLLPATCQFIDEPQPDRGPLCGFVQGLAQVDAAWILLLACDLPNLTTPLIRTWMAGLAAVPPQSVAYLPRHPKGWEPLCGFYRPACRAAASDYTAAGGKSFQGWLATQQVTELPIADPQCLANCNTPADLVLIAAQPSDRSRIESDPSAILDPGSIEIDL